MPNWDILSWITGYVGLAALALWLQYRSHTRAYAKLSELYEKTMAVQATLIEVIKLDIDALRTTKDAQ